LAQAGAELGDLVQQCARDGLSGVECLVGIPGSIGGAIRMNAGGRFGDIGSVVRKVTVMETNGEISERRQDDLYFGYRTTNIMAKFVLDVELQMAPADPEQIGKMIKEVWMLKKNTQPMNSRNAGCVFKNPRAISAGAMIDKVGLKGTHVGGAVVSDRHANFIIAEDNCTSADVLKLIDLIREKVRERFDVELELELEIWR
jgi:UDP-N-acetylmuramate dehydrogenase